MTTLQSLGLAVLQAAALLALAPLLRGGIKKMKAALQSRQGPPLLQGYYDLVKLLRKEPVRSETSSWVFVAGPRLYFATAVAATTLVPVLFAGAPLEGAGGILVLVGLLALGRFALATAALDTGSPFGGMGSSREMTVGALAEPALMLGLFTVALWGGSLNLGQLVRATVSRGPSAHPSELLAAAALFIVLIAEAGRVPVDNPATHLELTMIHEAMVLEYAGPDLALVEWASALKELLFMTVLANLFLPLGLAVNLSPAALGLAAAFYAGKVLILAVAVTLVEATNAKLRFFRVPELMAASLGLGFLALAIRFCEASVMTADDVVILCAAGMLVTAYLMVAQKALFVTIRLYGLQSLLLGVVAVAMGLEDHRSHLFIGAALTIGLKGIFIPWFLMRIIDRIGIHREIEPYLNVPSSLLICLGLTVLGYRVSTGLAEGGQGVTHHVIGVSLSMLLMGLFLMVSRRKAVTQILALLTVENAVFLVALGATSGMPLVVELGISFDVILAVLVLGILVHRIVDRFESMDVSRLSRLKG